MPKRFADRSFDPGAIKAMMDAFGKACAVLGLVDREDYITESLAKMIVEQARSGERNPDRLCAMTLDALKR
jgi:hypothetical protein